VRAVTDEIRLELPRDREFFGVAHLVLGGLAVRLDLTFEHLEDLQLALAGLLEREEGNGEVTLAVRVQDDAIEATVGPFGDSVRAELAGGGEEMGLRRVLETVVDRVRVADRDGDAWVELTKRLQTIGEVH
jgi:anti-sigma regulatory factor (Ser/Thr protein kinase)